ncbi:MAG: ABC transporter ATP-binding protein [Anaerolineae bacterium]|jgi:heme exporter protein A|nr:ABC transporter ATP-binding protein [Anaerolineae bacterium]MDH7472476.1 ABC transporter ATP-binding protein [Anaerolineae bacterium]
MIRVRGLVKTFGNTVALQDVDLDVAEGEFLTVVGANGAGKTTLIRVLATLSRSTAGEVRIGGLDPARDAITIRRRIGVVSHQPLLYGDLSAVENLTFYGRMYDVPALPCRIGELLDLVGLSARRNDAVRTFSQGMRQRLAIARAFLHDPAILLLDEPFSGLDQQATAMLGQMLGNPGPGRERTVVVTTHDLERGLGMGDRLAVLARGQIVYQACRDELDLARLRAIYQSVSTL